MKWILGIYWILMTGAAALAAARFRLADKATRYICILVLSGLLTELLSLWTSIVWSSNVLVYRYSRFLELLLICGFFAWSVPAMRRPYRRYLLGATGLFTAVLILYLETFTHPGPDLMFLDFGLVFCWCVYAVAQWLLHDADEQPTYLRPQFLIPWVLLLGKCCSIWSWVAYDQMLAEGRPQVELLHTYLLLSGILMYSGLGTLLFFYPKMNIHEA